MPPRNRQSIAERTGQAPANGSPAKEEDPQVKAAREELDAQIRGGGAYYDTIAPPHVNGRQYTAMVVGYLHANPKLYIAALANQTGFMAALADCARLGLVLGDEYAILHFKNNTTGIPDITGFTTAAGEIELMFRTGRVQAVVAQAVRVHDTFRRGRTLTEPPYFEPGGSTRTDPRTGEQLDISGFGGDLEARGPLRGVFAYAELAGGGNTEVAYLGIDQIARRRAKARTEKMWGPPWPDEGPDTEAMWVKSGVHQARKRAPRSAQYVMARMEQESVIASTPVPRGLAPPPRAELDDNGAMPAITTGTVVSPQAAPPAAPERPQAAAGKPVGVDTLGTVFAQLGVTGGDLAALLSGLAGRQVKDVTELNPGEAAAVAAKLRTAADGAASEKITLARSIAKGGQPERQQDD